MRTYCAQTFGDGGVPVKMSSLSAKRTLFEASLNSIIMHACGSLPHPSILDQILQIYASPASTLMSWYHTPYCPYVRAPASTYLVPVWDGKLIFCFHPAQPQLPYFCQPVESFHSMELYSSLLQSLDLSAIPVHECLVLCLKEPTKHTPGKMISYT